MLSEYILIGQVLRPQGVDGLVKVRPDTDDPDRFLDLSSAFIQEGKEYRAIQVEDAAVRQDGFVYLRLDNAQKRNEAEKQRGWMLYVDRAHARKLNENEYFICDLIGCRAYDTKGNEIGKLVDVMQPGANDVYVFKTARGEMLLPALKQVVLETDVAAQRMVLNDSRLHEFAVYEREP